MHPKLAAVTVNDPDVAAGVTLLAIAEAPD
jgi:hypothetical protein